MSKFITRDPVTGELIEESGLVVSTGATDAGRIPQANAQGYLDTTWLPPGIGDDARIIEAGENLGAGAFVNVYDDAGTTKVRNADANSPGKGAQGFVREAFTSGQQAKVFFEGTNDQLTGLTGGVTYFLSDTIPGGVVSTPVTGAGKLHQIIGRSVSATAINFEGETTLILA